MRGTCFLFDMDGLLLDTERVCRKVFAQTTAHFGAASDGDEDFFLSLIGASSHVTRARLAEYLPASIGWGAFDTQWRKGMFEAMKDGVPLRPHVEDVLTNLSDGGARMAVVTSSRKATALHHLEDSGLLSHFEHVLGGDEVSENKPHPAPYIEAAALLGADPTDCFAFEDSDRGIAAAVAAGCKAVQIPDLRPLDVELPELGQHVARDLRDAMRILGVF